jgi:molybdopterin converting factor small subunit
VATVVLPRSLAELFPAAPRQVTADGSTVGAVIEDLDTTYPGMRQRLLDAGPVIRRHLLIFVDAEKAGLGTAVAPGSEVRIVPALSGG